jgi:hypothetical protein
MPSRHDAANRHKRDDRNGDKQQGKIDQVHGVNSIPLACCDAGERGLNCDLDAGSKGGGGSKVYGEWQPAGGHNGCL